jgi:hypothetical protein
VRVRVHGHRCRYRYRRHGRYQRDNRRSEEWQWQWAWQWQWLAGAGLGWSLAAVVKHELAGTLALRAPSLLAPRAFPSSLRLPACHFAGTSDDARETSAPVAH